jgi:Predicted nucleotide-binding protein containing TIR-like domain
MADPRTVFVVYGRNELARKAMFEFLRSLGLDPMEWTKAVARTGEGAPAVKKILDTGFARAQAVVVLLTGDDVARLGTRFITPHDAQHERELTPQARPNVLFEAGMAFGLHPDRTILVQLGAVRPLSDLGGLHMIRLTNSIPSRQALGGRLETAGCPVDLVHQMDWHTAGDFEAAAFLPDSAPELPVGPRADVNLLERMKQAIRDGANKGWEWRKVSTLARKAGISETEALHLLQSDRAIELGQDETGERLAKLR